MGKAEGYVSPSRGGAGRQRNQSSGGGTISKSQARKLSTASLVEEYSMQKDIATGAMRPIGRQATQNWDAKVKESSANRKILQSEMRRRGITKFNQDGTITYKSGRQVRYASARSAAYQF